MVDLYLLIVIIIALVAIIIYKLLGTGCRHEWRKIHSESMWDSNVRVITYQCLKCGKIKRVYQPI